MELYNSSEKKENEIIVDKKIVHDFLRTVLKMEQENLYIKKHGLKDKIKNEVIKRIS